METKLTMREVLDKYCKFNADEYFLGLQEGNEYKIMYLFKFTIYNDDEVDLWRSGAKLHTFTSPEKLEMFFKSLE